MKKWIAAAVLFSLALPFGVHAEGNTAIKIKGEGVKSQALEVEGTLYTEPKLLEVANKWKVAEEGGKLYVLVSSGDKKTEKVQIPEKEIDGKSYVDFSYFHKQSGLDYEYNEKKHLMKIKKQKAKKAKKGEANHKEKEPVFLLWDPDGEFGKETPYFSENAGRRLLAPTWGSYEGMRKFTGIPDFDYLKQAKERGMEVMPLIHNDFDLEGTATWVRDKKGIDQWAKKMAALAEVYDLAGYNIDFECMKQKDAPLFTDFIRDIATPLHDIGKELSVDITVYNEGSSIWSLCYDRKGLSAWADYQVVMGYDETPQASRYAGSVSSYPWLESGIKRLLQDIPSEKLILGLPFYTRVWKGNPGYVTSGVLTIKYSDDFIKNHHLKPYWDKTLRQHVACWTEDGVKKQVWLEDGDSLSEKMKLGKSYQLAGYAFWRHGFESDTIYEKLEK